MPNPECKDNFCRMRQSVNKDTKRYIEVKNFSKSDNI